MNQPQQEPMAPKPASPSQGGQPVISMWLLIVFIIVLLGGGGYLLWYFFK